jgi:hypothetical protein
VSVDAGEELVEQVGAVVLVVLGGMVALADVSDSG